MFIYSISIKETLIIKRKASKVTWLKKKENSLYLQAFHVSAILFEIRKLLFWRLIVLAEIPSSLFVKKKTIQVLYLITEV